MIEGSIYKLTHLKKRVVILLLNFKGKYFPPPFPFDYVASWRMEICFSLSVNVHPSTPTTMSPTVSKSVQPSFDVKNIGVIYANGGKVCLNCLLVEDNRPLIIIWAAFEHLQTVIVQKLKPSTERGSV